MARKRYTPDQIIGMLRKAVSDLKLDALILTGFEAGPEVIESPFREAGNPTVPDRVHAAFQLT